jgi:hypothetical protein
MNHRLEYTSTTEEQDIMKQLAISFAVIALVAQTAQAGHLGLGGWGGPGLGGHHGGFGGGDSRGGLVGFDTERLQTRFETKFEDLQTDYDTGLADIEDFYSTDDYTDVVDGVENLVDRYDLFLSGVERAIDRIGDFITIATDDLTFYEELLAEYEARDDLSEERLERIVERLTNAQDHLTTKIDLLTEKQTMLTDKFGSYEAFSSDLSEYLAEILAAGGGTTDTGATTDETVAEIVSGAVALRSAAEVATLSEETSFCEPPESALAATAVPEPGTQLLLVVVLGLLALRRQARGRPSD